MKIAIFLALVALVCSSSSTKKGGDTPRDRALKLLAQMTFDEKLAMVHGYNGDYVGNVPSNSRLSIPAINLEDGPQGVADGTTQVTCWPSALTVIASWDPDVNNAYGQAMGEEQRLKGSNVMLGPMVNIARVPMGGRNFESYGEDPVLSAAMVGPSINGIQSQGVIACVKHYVDNNQEYNRTLVSENVPERAQWEIYYPAFQAAVNADVGSVMCSYNRINNTYACENNQTLNSDLKEYMGFQGWVMSDWGATHSTVNAANFGLDQQMPDDEFFGQALADAIQSGEVPMERLDDMVVRILTPMFGVGLFDNPQTGNLSVNAMSDAHNVLARQLSQAGTVLLKNDDSFLPLNENTIQTIAVIGDVGNLNPIVSGQGSGHVIAPYIVTPLQGIQSRVSGTQIKVVYAPTNPIDQAVAVAKAADVAIVVVGTWSSEGSDRPDLNLGNNQDQLVAAVSQAQPNTAVIVHTPGAVLMPWLSSVPAVLCSFMPGQEDGNAISEILFGDFNPSGKLPVTFPPSNELIPVNTVAQYPGIDNEANYSEELLVGYRWYDANSIEPLFPFGHGLSYTTFEYSSLEMEGDIESGLNVSFELQNVGEFSGAEVAQLYIGYPSQAGEPPKSLRYFRKVNLDPQDSQLVLFTLSSSDVSIWEVSIHNWAIVGGQFTVYIGSSSRDIRLTGTFNN